MAKPLKQLMTACWMSSPRLSKALIVDSRRPGLRAQNMWMFTALPSLILTSTYNTPPEKPKCSEFYNLAAKFAMREWSITSSELDNKQIGKANLLVAPFSSKHIHLDNLLSKECAKKIYFSTLAGWPLGLSSELGQSSSLIRLGKVSGVGVNGWKLGVGASELPAGTDSSSLWRSLILCRSSLRYSMASPKIEALSICHTRKQMISNGAEVQRKRRRYETCCLYKFAGL